MYCWTVRESLKSMLALGWSIDRTREEESVFQQREMEKMRRVSQASQVLTDFILDRQLHVMTYNVC